MILISTLRKMIARDPLARVRQLTIKAHTVRMSTYSVDVGERVEYFATDRQVGERQYAEFEILRACNLDASTLIVVRDVLANDAAKAQGFDFLASSTV